MASDFRLLVLLLFFFAVVAASKVAYYSCDSVAELPEHECILNFEEAAHTQLCDGMAKDRDSICTQFRSKGACESATREHNEMCKQARTSIHQWHAGSESEAGEGNSFMQIAEGDHQGLLLGLDIPCSATLASKCEAYPCIDLREGTEHHHLMWLTSEGNAQVKYCSGDACSSFTGSWSCTSSASSGLVGTWSCPSFYDGTITVAADYAGGFTSERDNDNIYTCDPPRRVRIRTLNVWHGGDASHQWHLYTFKFYADSACNAHVPATTGSGECSSDKYGSRCIPLVNSEATTWVPSTRNAGEFIGGIYPESQALHGLQLKSDVGYDTPGIIIEESRDRGASWDEIKTIEDLSQTKGVDHCFDIEVPTPAPTTPAPTNAPTTLSPTNAPTMDEQGRTLIYHQGMTGPDFPGLLLPDGTAADPQWYVPYQAKQLPSHLQGCNPASCSNPSSCGIPQCWGVKWNSPSPTPSRAHEDDMRYLASSGYLSEQEAWLTDGLPDGYSNHRVKVVTNATAQGLMFGDTFEDGFSFIMIHAGTRFGYILPMVDMNLIRCIPTVPYEPASNYYPWRDVTIKVHNPIGFKVCMQGGFLKPTVLSHIASRETLQIVTLMQKSTFCLNPSANSDSSAVCYSQKLGVCLRFKSDVWDSIYDSQVGYSNKVAILLKYREGAQNYESCLDDEVVAHMAVVVGR